MCKKPIGCEAGDECAYMGVSWDVSNMDSASGKSKGLAKRNPEDMPHKNNSNYKGATQRLSESAFVSIQSTCE